MRTLSIREALCEALEEEMALDESIFLMGEEVGHYEGAYKVSRGLLDKFGEKRVIDTPIAENGFAAVGIGAAMVGLRPVIEFMTFNFSLIGIDQVINTAAKVRYMSGGQFKCPIVFRGPGGSVHQLSAQHSQSLESFYAHIPGLKVVMPSNSKDAKGLLKSSIRDDNPIVFIESEAMYGVKGEVPDDTYLLPIGKADIKKEGSDVTIICWSKSVPLCLEAAKQLEDQGVNAEVIDLMTVRPLDRETLTNSIKKTNRAMIVQESWPQASLGHWVAASLTEELFDHLDAPLKVISGKDYPYPYAKNLEALMRTEPSAICDAARSLM